MLILTISLSIDYFFYADYAIIIRYACLIICIKVSLIYYEHNSTIYFVFTFVAFTHLYADKIQTVLLLGCLIFNLN